MPSPNAESSDDLLRELARDGLEFRILPSAEITDEIAMEMLAHFNAAFERWPWTKPAVSQLDYLRWKMSSPASPLGSYQGRLDGLLVYATTVFASWVRLGGVRRLRVSFLDASVDPEMRGRRIFSRAVAYQQVMRYRCDFSMHERSAAAIVQRRLERRVQRPFANRVKILSRILAPSGLPSFDRPRGVLAAAASFTQWAFGTLVAATRSKALERPRTVERFDQRFDELFEAVAGSFDLIAERTSESLSWRYGDPRAGRHVARELTEGDRLAGYAVVRIVESRAYLSDLLARPDRPRAIDTLVADAVEFARESGARTLECWLPRRHPYRGALLRQGFFDRGRDAGVSYHPVELDAAELAPLDDPRARIHYMLGDTDLV